MPGTLHQGILLLFQDDPWLAFDLLGIERPTAGIPIDRRGEIERDGPDPMTFRVLGRRSIARSAGVPGDASLGHRRTAAG